MTKTQQNFTLYQGQDRTIQIPVVDEDGAAKTMTGGTPTFYAFDDPSDALTDAIISIADGDITIISIDGTDDGVQIVFEDADTESVDVGDYFWEGWVADPAGNDNPVATGWLTIKPSPKGRS